MIKSISFPEKEISDLINRHSIVTHRVSDDLIAFDKGDVVITPWNRFFKVTEKTVVDSIWKSPYAEDLTSAQFEYLEKFDEIAVLKLNALFEEQFDNVIRLYNEKLGIDLSYMRFIVSVQPLCRDGSPCYRFDPSECGGDWTEHSLIRLNPDMVSVMDRYGVKRHSLDDVDEFAEVIIAHELAHELWTNVVSESFKYSVLTAAAEENFSTAYLATVSENKLPEETFCEYIAQFIINSSRKGNYLQ